MIIDALGLLMGNRISGDLVRNPDRKAVIEGVFFIPNQRVKALLEDDGLCDEDEDLLILRREISEGGRSTARINGRTVPLSRLRELGHYLVDIHLQHDNQLLLNPGMYRYFLDSFIPDAVSLLQQVREIYDRWQERRREVEELLSGEKDRVRELDFLQFQIREIDSAALIAGEEEELTLRRDRLRNAEQLRAGADEIHRLVYSGGEMPAAYDLIAAAVETVNALKEDSFFADIVTPLETCLYTLEDIGVRLSEFRERLEFEPRELEEIEERLETIKKLKKKYGDSIPKILEFLARARREKERLENSEMRAGELQNEVKELGKEYCRLTGLLSEQRRKAAELLQTRVHQELQQLGMPGVRLLIEINPREVPGRDGMDQVTFLFSANPGEEPRPLSRVASGGEISRFVLALKKALAEAYDVPTLIFDEIDVGVGGSALNAVARKLFELSLHHQVVLVTHSAQVASYADCHYLLEKALRGGVTMTRARKLGGQERVEEIARMLSGDDYSQLSLEHAQEIISMTDTVKKKIRNPA